MALKFTISGHAAAQFFGKNLSGNVLPILSSFCMMASWIGLDGFGLLKPHDLHPEALHRNVAGLDQKAARGV